MRADSPRDNLPPRMRCGDPLSTGAYLMDQSGDTPSFPPPPSIPQDHLEPSAMKRVDAKLQHLDYVLTQLDLALAVGARLMELLGTHGITLESFKTEAGARMQIVRKGNQYDVTLRPGRLGS